MIVRRNQVYRQGIGRLRFNADAIILHLAVIRIAVIWFIDPAAIVLIADYGPDSETIRDDRYIEGCVAAIIKASTVSLRSRNAHLSFKFRSEEHTSELQSLMRISYAVFCLKKKTNSK